MHIPKVTGPNPSVGYSFEPASFVDVLRYRAIHQADQKAYIFLADGKTEEASLTFAELDRRARAIAASLQAIDAAGKPVLLLYPSGLEYISAFMGCLYAKAIAVPAYPPRSNRNLDRLQAIVNDAQPLIAFTTDTIVSRLMSAPDQTLRQAVLQWQTMENITDELASQWQDPGVESHTLAFLQYTSGSTATPKGVMVSHNNLLHNERMIEQAFQQTEESVIVGWLPLFHDMGLIGNVLLPLYVGASCIFMSPASFLQKPIRWLETISRYRATTSGGPNFAYDLCYQKIQGEEIDHLDLSSWSVAFNGSEPVKRETLDRFADAFEPCGFRRESFFPCYGLAEATLFVSGHHEKAQADFPNLTAGRDPQNLVSCGRAWLEQRIVIVEPESCTQLPLGKVGEIWVSGASIAQGYWKQSEESQRTFQAYLADTGEGPFLRTGDLGVIANNQLFVTGRLKDLIIIRGWNHYPQDIEQTVERTHKGLRRGAGAAFSVDVAGEERLFVVQEVERSQRNLDVEEAAAAIRQAVAEEHELQVYSVVLIKPGSIPKTSSGKIQRQLCRKNLFEGRLEVIGASRLDIADYDSLRLPDNSGVTREKLIAVQVEAERHFLLAAFIRDMVARVLRVASSRINPHQPLTTLGLDSLMAAELKHTLESSLGISMPVTTFFQATGVDQLASYALDELLKPFAAPSIRLLTSKDVITDYRLSYGQQALWFLHQLAPQTATYNLPTAVRIRSELDLPALAGAFQKMTERHPCLRTTFNMKSGSPVQQVHPQQTVCFRQLDASAWDEPELTRQLTLEAHKPFDLEQGPLFRVIVFTRSEVEHILLLNVHHLVADFWSLQILLREFAQLYAAEKRGDEAMQSALPLQYADYVHWQTEMLASPRAEQLWNYWRGQLAGAPLEINLPTDRPRPPVQSYNGASLTFRLGEQITGKLKSLAKEQESTLNMVLLAVFQILLHRYTGQKEILVGTPTAGAKRDQFAETVGYFVNPVVVRTTVARKPSPLAFIRQVRQTLLAAMEHQDFPFSLLAERLQPLRNPSRSPLFQVMFIWQRASDLSVGEIGALALGEAGVKVQAGEFRLESVAFPQQVAQFELTLMMTETSDGLMASLQYNTDLFEASTGARIARHFQTLAESFVTHPDKSVSELQLLTEAELKQILFEWNDEETKYGRDKLVHEMIAAQAAMTPDAIAVVFEDERFTYQCLNERANQLAHYLKSVGIGAENLVGICMHRSPQLLIGLLGILKAGSAYVPLDPAYPSERLAFMLEDAGVAILVTEQKLTGHLPGGVGVVCLDTDWKEIACHSRLNPLGCSSSEQLAYVIYTSGSTGRPKGVMLSHRNVVNFFAGMDKRVGCRQEDRLMAVTSISFDISVLELFWTLSCGAQVILLAEPVSQGGSLEAISRKSNKALNFSLFYFASAGANAAGDTYRLLFEGAKFADEHGFEAVWTPERHFHDFGGLYPNPSVMSAALAAQTKHLAIRAGSVVLPLHHPVRVAEEWALVDNISNGRVGISVASGWHADDFVFFPENYTDRKELMFSGIETVKKLWRGEPISVIGGAGSEIEVKILPRPIQPELPIWITAAGSSETFIRAGEIGANLLTHLLGQSLEQLAEKIQQYRQSLTKNGYNPHSRQVTLMLHTFIGEEKEAVREKVREPFIQYLRSSVGLIANLVKSLNLPLELDKMSEKDMDDLLAFAFDRYFDTSALFGTPATCQAMTQRLKDIDVDEVACLVDFGIDADSVLASLPLLNQLKELTNLSKTSKDYSLAAQARRCEPSLLQCTPSMMRMLGYTSESLDFLGSLHTLLLGGEALPPALAREVKSLLPIRLINMYGPTETTIWSATHEVNEINSTVSIGRPIANTQIYIFDSHLQPVPGGVSGELYISGDGCARGYYRRPELTAEKFIPNPFNDQPGTRIYATGDLARHRLDGVIEHLGRLDYQVKIRGFRVELEEIEARLGEHPGVREGVIIAHEDASGNTRLVAYLVSNEEKAPDLQQLRSFLKERLPDYMVPTLFVALDSLPLTDNGKVNRKALPSPEHRRIDSKTEYVAPRNKLEQSIATIWQEVLKIERVGLMDNFFDLGGHSLLMAQVHGQLKDKLGLDLQLIKLLEHPTISSLAKYLTDNQSDELPLQQSRNRALQQREAFKRQRQSVMRTRLQ
jgi:natural product biosynthesis luciferase-like monooxygenase protein